MSLWHERADFISDLDHCNAPLCYQEQTRLAVTAVGEDHLATTTGGKKVLIYSSTTGLGQGEIVCLSPVNISALALQAHTLYVVTGSRVEVWDLTTSLCLAVIQAKSFTTPLHRLAPFIFCTSIKTQYYLL